jgi:hypothetical protein
MTSYLNLITYFADWKSAVPWVKHLNIWLYEEFISLKAGSSRVLFPMLSKFFNLSNPSSCTVAPELTQLPTEMSTRSLLREMKCGRRVRLTVSLSFVRRLSRKCGILDVSTVCYRDSFALNLLYLREFEILSPGSSVCVWKYLLSTELSCLPCYILQGDASGML